MPLMEYWDDEKNKAVTVSTSNPLPMSGGGGGGTPAPGSITTEMFAEDAKAPFAGKADSADNVAWSGVSGKPNSYPPSTHTHTIADIESLQSTLNDILSRLSALESGGVEE